MKRGVVMGLMIAFLLTLPEIGTRSSKLTDNTKTRTAEKTEADAGAIKEDEDMTDDVRELPDAGHETNGNNYDKSFDEHYRERDTGKVDQNPLHDVDFDSSAKMAHTFIDYSANNHRLQRDQSDDEKRDNDESNNGRSRGRLLTDTSDDMPKKYYQHEEIPLDNIQSRRMGRVLPTDKEQSHDIYEKNVPNVNQIQDREESHLRNEKLDYDVLNEKLPSGASSNDEISINVGKENNQINLKQRHNTRLSDSNLKLEAIDYGSVNHDNAKVRKDYLDSKFDDEDDRVNNQDSLGNRDTRKATKGKNYVVDNINDKEASRKTLTSESDAKNELKRHLHSLSSSEISDLFKTFTAEEKNVVEDLLKEDEEDKIYKRELHKNDQSNLMETSKLGSDEGVTIEDILEKDRPTIDSIKNVAQDIKATNEKDPISTNFNNPDQLVQILSDSQHTNLKNALRTDKLNTLCSEESKDNLKKFDKTTNTETNDQAKFNKKRDVDTIASSEINRDGESPNIIKSFVSTTLRQEDTTETIINSSDTEEAKVFTEKINIKDNDKQEVEPGNATVVKRDAGSYERTAKRHNYSPKYYRVLDDEQGHMRALEDSFPRTRESKLRYFDDDSSALEPLIRVKRTSRMRRRQAGLMPESRIAYVPYRSEDDEDTDEGSEFDDDGFDDRTSNLAKRNSYYYDASDERPRYSRGNSYANDLVSEFNGYDNPRDTDYGNNQGRAPRYLFNRYKSRPIRGKNTLDRNVYARSNDDDNVDLKDERSIGSDTDNVLSGVNGADENLMYSGNVRLRRDRRSIRRSKKDNHKSVKKSKLKRNTNLDNMDRDLRTNRKSMIRNENFYAPNLASTDYRNDLSTIMEKGKDSDVFGGLPLNYQSDLNRFKRIRRTKS